MNNEKKSDLLERAAHINEIATAIYDIFEDNDVSEEEAFATIGVIFTHLMMQCESRDEATFFMNTVNENVCRTMNSIEEAGMSPWERGTPN